LEKNVFEEFEEHGEEYQEMLNEEAEFLREEIEDLDEIIEKDRDLFIVAVFSLFWGIPNGESNL
jgi:hypothetical protein